MSKPSPKPASNNTSAEVFDRPLHDPLSAGGFTPEVQEFARRAFLNPVQPTRRFWSDTAGRNGINPGDPIKLVLASTVSPVSNNRFARTVLGPQHEGSMMELFAKEGSKLQIWSDVMAFCVGYDIGTQVVPVTVVTNGEVMRTVAPRPGKEYETWGSRPPRPADLSPFEAAGVLAHAVWVGKDDNHPENMLGTPAGSVATFDHDALSPDPDFFPCGLAPLMNMHGDATNGPEFDEALDEYVYRVESYPDQRLQAHARRIGNALGFDANDWQAANEQVGAMMARRHMMRSLLAENGADFIPA